MKNEEFATAVNSFDSSSISMIKENPKNPLRFTVYGLQFTAYSLISDKP